MSLLRERLQALNDGAGPSPLVGDGLYVVVVCESMEPIVAAFADEGIADELAEWIGDSATVSYEPVADNHADLLAAIVRHYLGEEL